MVHVLKISPSYFAEVESGRKSFEVRFNDRNFHQGDVIVLNEFDSVNSTYSGRVLCCVAGTVYHLSGMNLLCANVCVFGLIGVHRVS